MNVWAAAFASMEGRGAGKDCGGGSIFQHERATEFLNCEGGSICQNRTKKQSCREYHSLPDSAMPSCEGRGAFSSIVFGCGVFGQQC